mgnify:CR=1 FL=1
MRWGRPANSPADRRSVSSYRMCRGERRREGTAFSRAWRRKSRRRRARRSHKADCVCRLLVASSVTAGHRWPERGAVPLSTRFSALPSSSQPFHAPRLRRRPDTAFASPFHQRVGLESCWPSILFHRSPTQPPWLVTASGTRLWLLRSPASAPAIRMAGDPVCRDAQLLPESRGNALDPQLLLVARKNLGTQ